MWRVALLTTKLLTTNFVTTNLGSELCFLTLEDIDAIHNCAALPWIFKRNVKLRRSRHLVLMSFPSTLLTSGEVHYRVGPNYISRVQYNIRVSRKYQSNQKVEKSRYETTLPLPWNKFLDVTQLCHLICCSPEIPKEKCGVAMQDASTATLWS